MSLTMIDAALLAWAFLATPASAADLPIVITFGDSTTATRGDLTIYSQVISEEIRGIKVINAGIGGNNTNHAKARFDKDVLDPSPDIVVIQFGINDAAIDVWKDPPATASRVSLADYETNLRQFIDTLAENGTAVILMTPNPLRWTERMREMYGQPPYNPKDEDGFNFRLKQYAGKVRGLAEEKKLPLVDVYQLFEAHGAKPGKSVDELLLDGVHPNEAGQRIVADRLIPLVRKKIKDAAADRASSPALKLVTNPTAPRRAATVSKVVFQVTATSLINRELRYRPHDISGTTLGFRIADMTPFGPADALSRGREDNKWNVFEYETDGFSGK